MVELMWNETLFSNNYLTISHWTFSQQLHLQVDKSDNAFGSVLVDALWSL